MTNPPVPHRSILGCPTRIALPTAAIVLLAVITTSAGPIDPPPGPITPTYKTLTEVEPRTAINLTNTPGDADSLFKITQRGSYYLTGNITGVVGKHGIEITSGGVTIDLMGFDLSGVPGSLDGIAATVNNLRSITIRNGSVRTWGDVGVDLRTESVRGGALLDVRATDNGGGGLAVGSAFSITRCSAYLNTGDGMQIGFISTVSECSSGANTGNGFWMGDTVTITGCSADGNQQNGISVGYGCVVSGCALRLNYLDGIRVNANSTILNNTCINNGFGFANDGAGIHVVFDDSRVEGNNCLDNDRGIDIDGAGNIIIRNTCANNTTDWAIVANNIYGPILDRRIPAAVASTPAVSGTAAASTLGSTDPNANFSY